jgi:hypothetical protein
MTTWTEQEILYSPGADLLLSWGAHLIERPDLSIERDMLAGAISEWDRNELLADFRNAWPSVLKDAHNARAFLESRPVIPNDFTDPDWNEAIDALRAFDQVVHLWVAVEDLFSDNAPELIDELEARYYDISEWLDNAESFTSLRLVPLNEWRKNRIERVEASSRFLFPWLADMAWAPADALEQIEAHWNAVREKGVGGLSFIAEPDRLIFWDYLKRDIGLQQEMENRRRLNIAIADAVDQSLPLQLLRIYEQHVQMSDVPEHVLRHGLANAACAALTGDRHDEASHEDLGPALETAVAQEFPVERVLTTALCGPFLSDAQRFSAFKWAASKLEKDARMGGLAGVFTQVGLWMRNELTDNAFADALMAAWDRMAEDAMTSVAAEEVADKHALYTESNIFQLMRQAMGAFARLAMDNFKDCMAMTARMGTPEKPLLEMPLSGDGGSGAADEDVLLFDDGNFVAATIDFEKNKPLPILGRIEGNQRLDELIDRIESRPRYYLFGWRLLSNGEKHPILEKIKRCQGTPAFDFDMDETGFDALAFAVSANKRILEKILNNHPIAPDEASRVVWVVYHPEENA